MGKKTLFKFQKQSKLKKTVAKVNKTVGNQKKRRNEKEYNKTKNNKRKQKKIVHILLTVSWKRS